MLTLLNLEAFGDDAIGDTGVEKVDSLLKTTNRTEQFEISSVISSLLLRSRHPKLLARLEDIIGELAEDHLNDKDT